MTWTFTVCINLAGKFDLFIRRLVCLSSPVLPSLLSIFETASTYLAMVERFGTSLRSGNPKWHIVKLSVARAHRSDAIPLG